MTTQQEQSKLNQLINTSEIREAIESLQTLLKFYEQSNVVRNNRYEVILKFCKLNTSLLNLQNELDLLADLSIDWESAKKE